MTVAAVNMVGYSQVLLDVVWGQGCVACMGLLVKVVFRQIYKAPLSFYLSA
jgi:hypothetical protein